MKFANRDKEAAKVSNVGDFDLDTLDGDVVEDDVLDEDLVDEEFESAVSARYADADSSRNLDVTQMYLSEIGFSPLLTAEEEVYFSRLSLKGDPKARKRMIESNLRLVVKISRRYLG